MMPNPNVDPVVLFTEVVVVVAVAEDKREAPVRISGLGYRACRKSLA